jgi:phage-related minor tail protein
MSDPGNTALNDSLGQAAQAFADFANGPVANTTQTIETAVTRSFNAVAATISRTALSGRASIAQMTDAVLSDFDRIAASQFIVKPVEGVVSSLIASLMPVSGARDAGGPVAAGSTYLVGEQGPELFTPASGGQITPNGALGTGGARPSVVVNIQTPDAASFAKSRNQIAAMMSRALAQGQRNL